ncbi:MAG: PAS domain-containing protein [Deltaproteobacteria bacterium]|nr:PAS domain-containing protein [Deltaproteobacteria bacterium]
MESGSATTCAALPPLQPHPRGKIAIREQKADHGGDSPRQFAPARLVPLMVISIFLADVLARFLVIQAGDLSQSMDHLLDAFALLIVLSPTFYFFYYRPLQAHSAERKKMVDLLCDSEERLKLALDAVNDGLWDWNLVSGEVYANNRAAAMLGFDPQTFGSRIADWSSRLHPQDRARVKQVLREHLQGRSRYFRAEHRLRQKNGEFLWVMARGQVVARAKNNRPLRMIGTYTDISARKQAEEALRRNEADIRTLTQSLMLGAEEEKRHLAQDLHDEFGQVLCAFQLGVEMLRDHTYGGAEQYAGHCERLLSMAARLEVDLRHMCDHLRPVMLDDLGLVAALKWHLEQFAAQNPQVKTRFKGEELNLQLSQQTEIALYRICQEALNNVSKYAKAQQVEVVLQCVNDQLQLAIRDNGVGLSIEDCQPQGVGRSMGLLGMRERAATAGGNLRVVSAPGTGTTVEVHLPLEVKQDVPLENCA